MESGHHMNLSLDREQIELSIVEPNIVSVHPETPKDNRADDKKLRKFFSRNLPMKPVLAQQ